MKIGLTVASVIPLIEGNSRTNDVWYQDLDSKIIAFKNKLFFNKLMLDADFSYQANRRKLITEDFMPVDMNLVTYSYNIKNTYSLKNNSQIIGGIQGMLQTNENFDAPNHVIPNADLNDFAVYLMMSNKIKEKINFSAGLRYDYRKITTDEELNKLAVDRDFNDFSYSAGATYNFTKQFLLRANFASAHRTPNIAELTENGIHGDIYEVGNSNLKTQINYEPDVSLHFHNNFIVIDFATYYNRINDYIFLENTGDLTDGEIKIYEYNQTNAKIRGFETGFKVMPFKQLKVFANYSFIDAKTDDGDYLPFIPQNKINSEIKYVPKFKVLKFNFSSSIDFVYAFKQDKVSVFETETPEYFVTNFSVNLKRKIKKQTVQFAIKVSNLFDEVYVDHLSTNKDLGYFSEGRNITAVIKYVF
ncbi:MAG: TonB-dependent receptor [Chlorobi bacterium]|nr:TonB-dependent receptor [Chlorobiota bacterium]